VNSKMLMVAGYAFLLAATHSSSEYGWVSLSNLQGASQSLPQPAPQTNMAQGPNYKVNVTSVVEKSTLDGKVLYQITYSYDFGGRNSVYVRGLGTVSAIGKFSYLTADREVEFRQSVTGPVLTTVQLEETVRSMGSDSTELPKEGDFLQAFRSGTWTPPATFAETAVRVIQKYFPSGYNPRQVGQVNYYTTTYRNLEVRDRNLRSQLAVNISQPYDAAADKFTYRVQFVARDRPRLSGTWRHGEERSEQTKIAAEKFIDELIRELTSIGGKQQ
jgi:hypothetical protein